MTIPVVLHERQDLVNIAHVVRALKNFELRDLRLVNPREYDAHRIGGMAAQTQNRLARVGPLAPPHEGLAGRPPSGWCSTRGRRTHNHTRRAPGGARRVLRPP